LRERQVGTLTQDETSGQLQITYLGEWQRDGYTKSIEQPLDNQHTLTAAYNYVDNLLA
jgi:serine/threonine-protein kinase HipA